MIGKMKYTMLALLLVSVAGYSCTQTNAGTEVSGIKFEHLSLDEALDKAEKEGKLVFIDAYTTWCGPCKRMEKKTFQNAKVAEFYNENFVNIKIDMEKGEGPKLEKKYKIYNYPTLLYLEPNGDQRNKTIGYHEPGEFVRLGKKVLRKAS